MNNKIQILAAKAISNALSMLSVVVEATFILTYLETRNLYLSFGWTFVALVIVSGLLCIIYYFVRKGEFSDLDVSIRRQRPLLFLLGFIAALIFVTILFVFNAPEKLFLGNVTVFLILAVLSVVNKFFMKASGHMAMLSGALTLFVSMGGWIFMLGYILIPVLAWARLKTKRHTFREVIAGIVIGISVASLVLSI